MVFSNMAGLFQGIFLRVSKLGFIFIGKWREITHPNPLLRREGTLVAKFPDRFEKSEN